MKDKELDLKIKIATTKKLLEHTIQVRKERRDTFESWDRNSANLIAQYEKELADLTPKPH